MTFSNFTSLTIGLLGLVLILQLSILIYLWYQSKIVDSQIGGKTLEKRLLSMQKLLEKFQHTIEKNNLHTFDIKPRSNQAYQRANEMIKQSYTNDEIIATCKIAKGEIELLRVLNSRTNS